ncbi:hypothetical protein DSLASN_04460 [Desulfoluna limicola]|uniref:Uncharacterized protein n=1 Tax=Desulfoluna limicola TaxID=2810562 RepID=A0ABM7PBC2_9BACT|nr:hypothetical protein [Desulfoluna limicola]BCS94814.1 hypothetical protein DSLASN_04460 [Desulfoluna limicola]
MKNIFIGFMALIILLSAIVVFGGTSDVIINGRQVSNAEMEAIKSRFGSIGGDGHCSDYRHPNGSGVMSCSFYRPFAPHKTLLRACKTTEDSGKKLRHKPHKNAAVV